MIQALAVNEGASTYVLLEAQKSLQEIGVTIAFLWIYGFSTGMEHLPELCAPGRSQRIQSDIRNTVKAAILLFNERHCFLFNTVVVAILPGVSVESLQGLGGPSTEMHATTRFFFLDALRGIEKNLLFKVIQATLWLRGKSVLTVPTTAVAALLLEGV